MYWRTSHPRSWNRPVGVRQLQEPRATLAASLPGDEYLLNLGGRRRAGDPGVWGRLSARESLLRDGISAMVTRALRRGLCRTQRSGDRRGLWVLVAPIGLLGRDLIESPEEAASRALFATPARERCLPLIERRHQGRTAMDGRPRPPEVSRRLSRHRSGLPPAVLGTVLSATAGMRSIAAVAPAVP